jgi:hypothetical protein
MSNVGSGGLGSGDCGLSQWDSAEGMSLVCPLGALALPRSVE